MYLIIKDTKVGLFKQKTKRDICFLEKTRYLCKPIYGSNNNIK